MFLSIVSAVRVINPSEQVGMANTVKRKRSVIENEVK
jgi:hypothetical protein